MLALDVDPGPGEEPDPPRPDQIEGVEVIRNLDVLGEAGSRRALIKEIDTVVDDGAVDVSLRAVKVCAQVAGIEVIPLE